jgi:hypothetical protein
VTCKAKTFSTNNFCAPSVPTCDKPATLQTINPVDIPDSLKQISGSIGGPLLKHRTFFFAHSRLHAAGSDDFPLAHASGFPAACEWRPRLHR